MPPHFKCVLLKTSGESLAKSVHLPSLALQQREANYSGYKTEGLWPMVGMKGAINYRTVDRKLFGYRQNNNEVIATRCDRMITV